METRGTPEESRNPPNNPPHQQKDHFSYAEKRLKICRTFPLKAGPQKEIPLPTIHFHRLS